MIHDIIHNSPLRLPGSFGLRSESNIATGYQQRMQTRPHPFANPNLKTSLFSIPYFFGPSHYPPVAENRNQSFPFRAHSQHLSQDARENLHQRGSWNAAQLNAGSFSTLSENDVSVSGSSQSERIPIHDGQNRFDSNTIPLHECMNTNFNKFQPSTECITNVKCITQLSETTKDPFMLPIVDCNEHSMTVGIPSSLTAVDKPDSQTEFAVEQEQSTNSNSNAMNEFSCSQQLSYNTQYELFKKPPPLPVISSLNSNVQVTSRTANCTPGIASARTPFRTSSAQVQIQLPSPAVLISLSPIQFPPVPLEPPGFPSRLNQDVDNKAEDRLDQVWLSRANLGHDNTEIMDNVSGQTLTNQVEPKFSELKSDVDCVSPVLAVSDENAVPVHYDMVDENHTHNRAIIDNLTKILTATCASNGASLRNGSVMLESEYRSEAYPDGSSSVFYSLTRPAVNLRIYVLRLIELVRVSRSVFVVALAYLDRVHQEDLLLALNDLNVHRLLVVAIALAAKYIEDEPYRNSTMARIGCVPSVEEFNELEFQFLRRLNWNLTIKPSEYEMYSNFVL